MSKASKAPGTPVRAKKLRKRKNTTRITNAQRAAEGEGPIHKHWRTYFLEALIETSNVTASAARAGISPSRAYKVRRVDSDFAGQWRVALREGYENLEMELLGYLRNPDPQHKMDVANAIRLLSKHREFVAHERALEDNRSEQEVLDSIDTMIDTMRQRAAANAALLSDADPEDRLDAE